LLDIYDNMYIMCIKILYGKYWKKCNFM
jgi:hypothetical protein